MKSLFLALCLSLPVAPHDFFLSILTMRYAPEEKTLDLTWRMTAHDIEHALENVALLKLNSEREHPKADSILNDYLHQHLQVSMDGKVVDWTWVAKELERIALSDPYFIEKKLYPNVDFYSGIILEAMGFPTSMFTPVFAVARTVGWISQWKEQISDPQLKIGRPRQLYLGETERDYIDIESR